jgi:ABC-type Fe3+-hydroxamate transport system substrate-binding protein
VEGGPGSVRVVSLVPSSTETLIALHADVVACTRFCEQPDLAHVGGTKNPDLAAIIALRPDLVVMDREENRWEDAEHLKSAGISVFVSAVRSLVDARRIVADLADATGTSPPEFDLPGPSTAPTATAFVPIWRRPWMTIGAATYGADLLGALGVEVVRLGSDDPYPTVDLDLIAAARPDLVIAPSEPYEFSDDHLDEVARSLPTARIVRVDGRDLFWWGIRTPAAIPRLRAALGCGA